MGNTYTRQSTYTDGDTIQAADSNDEFDQLVLAFTADSGHSHDGTTGEGGDVTKLLGTAITIGDGTAGTDIVVTFDGETTDGVLTWKEDEDHFLFGDDVVIDGTKRLYFNDEGGEYITGDGTDLNIVSGADINIPANIGLTFGDDGEKIEGDGTDLTISGNNINLTAVADVNIPANVGVTFATAEKIESDGTDLTITVGSGGDINIPADIGVTFGNDGEKIEGDGTDLTISGNNINLTATADVVVPANVGVTFGSGEKIEGDNTDLTVTSGADINLTATSDVNIPANVGVTFGDDGEKIEGDGTDLTISGNNINLTATADVNIPSGVGVTFATAEKIESDGTDLSITVGAGGDINIPADIGLTFGDDGEKIEGDGTDLTISGNNINLTATADVVVPANVGITFGSGEKIEGDDTNLTVTSGGDVIIDAEDDIILDANGADVTLKDAGTVFGALTNSGGELVIKSGSSATTAMTMSGANVTFAGTVTIGSAGISEAELEILDGATVTTAELNIIDGDTSATSTTVADADRVVFNDNGTMVQVAVTDLAAYFDDEITAMPNLVTTAATTVGALDSGSITSGFGNIDNGASNITSGGLLKLDVDADADDLTGDSATGRLTIGAGEDLNLYHGGTNSYIVNDTGDLIIDTAGDIQLDAAGNDFKFLAGGTEILNITNSSSDVVIKPVVDAKDIIFQQRDGTEVARIEDNATFNVSSAGKFAYAGTAVTSTAGELNLLDGSAKSTSSITVADADAFIVIDGTTTKQIPASDIKTYAGGEDPVAMAIALG